MNEAHNLKTSFKKRNPLREKTSVKKINKYKLSNIKIIKKIPESKLKNTLHVINDADNAVWTDKNYSCAPGIFHRVNHCEGVNQKLVDYARNCLMRRDWLNLAKILHHSNATVYSSNGYLFSLYAKYAVICLAHQDKALLDTYLRSVHGIFEVEPFVEKITSF